MTDCCDGAKGAGLVSRLSSRAPDSHAGFAVFCVAAGAALSGALVRLYYFPHLDGWIRRGGAIAARNGGDYVNMFVGAHLAMSGRAGQLFDLGAYLKAARALTSDALPFHVWSYPPSLLLFVWPLALLPYGVGFAAWTLSGWAACLAAVMPAARPGRRWPLALALSISPAAILDVADGQNGFWTAAFLLGGLRLLEARPALAGILFGLLTIKPQLGLLVPVVLVVRRKWTAIGSASATAILLAAASAAVFGFQTWIRYLQATSRYEVAALEAAQGFFTVMMSSAFVSVRMLGGSIAAAWTIQAACFGFACAAVAYGALHARRFAALALVLACSALLATPYAFDYDMIGASAACLLFVVEEDASTSADRICFALLWLAPALVTFLYARFPIGPLALAAPVVLAISRIRAAREPGSR